MEEGRGGDVLSPCDNNCWYQSISPCTFTRVNSSHLDILLQSSADLRQRRFATLPNHHQQQAKTGSGTPISLFHSIQTHGKGRNNRVRRTTSHTTSGTGDDGERKMLLRRSQLQFPVDLNRTLFTSGVRGPLGAKPPRAAGRDGDGG